MVLNKLQTFNLFSCFTYLKEYFKITKYLWKKNQFHFLVSGKLDLDFVPLFYDLQLKVTVLNTGLFITPLFHLLSSFPAIFYHLLLFWRENYQFSCLFAFILHLFDCVILPSIAFATWGLKRGKLSPRWYFKNNLASRHASFSEAAAQSVDDTIIPMSSQMWCVLCQQYFLVKTLLFPLNISLY